MRRPHPLLVILLLLASLPAVVGGSLTHLCACEGLIYVSGCSCLETPAATAMSCPCGSPHQHTHTTPGAAHAPEPEDTPSPADTPEPSNTPGQDTPHDCDYMAYQLGISLAHAQLPPCPMAILHKSLIPLPVWNTSPHPLAHTAHLAESPLPGERQRPLLI